MVFEPFCDASEMVTCERGTCVGGLPGPKHNSFVGNGNVTCCVSKPEVVSITCRVPSSAPTNNSFPSGASDALSGVALSESDSTDEVCVFTLKTMTNGSLEGGGPACVSPIM